MSEREKERPQKWHRCALCAPLAPFFSLLAASLVGVPALELDEPGVEAEQRPRFPKGGGPLEPAGGAARAPEGARAAWWGGRWRRSRGAWWPGEPRGEGELEEGREEQPGELQADR